jgi:hypothetical protein
MLFFSKRGIKKGDRTVNYVEIKFSLAVDRVASQRSIEVKRGDTLNRLIISLSEHGCPYDIGEECRAFYIEDDIMHSCSIDNNRIIYDLTTQTVGTVGKHSAEIRLIGYNDEVITTARFTIIVVDTIYDDNQDETVPQKDVDALTELISEASELVERLQNEIVKGGSTVIGLEQYGIVQADFVEPFTAEMYEVAYNNGWGIQRAIDEAKENGLTEIILPAGNYPVCYSSDSDTTYNAIIDARGIDLVGYGAKLYVIYDEDGANPYFTGETPRLLQGTIIKTDRNVRGFHLVGERAYRKNENTKYREFSLGIGLTETTNGNLIKDCICELFSGDGIGCSSHMEQIAGWTGNADGLFTSVDWDTASNSFVESKTKFTSIAHGGNWIDKSRPILLRCDSYFLYTTAPLRVLCFDADDNYIGDVRFWQGEYFYLLPNTSKWYLQMTREVEHATTATEVWSYWIGYGYYHSTTIDNCEIRFNQRGGISNVPSGSKIKNCSIHHNGCAYEDMVEFYDSTQFGIDIEDVYIHDISIENCQISNNESGVLYRCWGIRFKDCSIYGYVNSLNSCVDFYAENTRFNWGCTMITPTPHGSKVAIGCTFGGNKAGEILEVENGLIASAKVGSDGVVNFLNSNGEVVFNMDLTTLIAIKPALVMDGLEIGCDFTALEEGATAFDTQYGNATVTASGGMIVNGGAVPVGNGKYVTITDSDSDYTANEFTIEMFCLGFPVHAMRSISGNYDLISSDAAGESISQNSINTCHISFPFNGGRAYKNYVFSKVYIDGVATTVNSTNTPKLEIDQYAHMVFVATNDGKVTCYINGYKSAIDVSASNFVSWDTSEFSKFYLYGGPANSNQLLKHFSIYNRALSEDEVKKNFNYFKSKEVAEEPATPTARIVDITIYADKWVGTASPYSQVVEVEGVTERSQVDLTPSVEQLSIFHNKDLAFVTENEDGVVTVYAIGQKPENDYIMQATVTEVNV